MATPLLLLATAFGQAPQPAQQAEPAPTTDLVLRISVALVQVDAVVTDGRGRLVTDLEARDFEILQDGKPQKITNFSFIKGPGSVRPAAPVRAQRPAAAAPAPPPKLRPEQVRSTVALVVDDLGLGFESTARVRDALRKFVDEQMQPGDLVAIVRTAAGMGALQQFTSDKRLLHAAIERVRFNPFGRQSIGTFGAFRSGEVTEADVRFDEFREEVYSVGTLGAVRFIVTGLKDLPGRKSVILFSENMRLFNSEGMSHNVMDTLRRLTDLANRASVVIYSVDPRGLQTLGLKAEDDVRDKTFDQVGEMLAKRTQDHFDSQEGMFYLARETGGLFLHNDNDLNASLRRVLDDQAGYYLIGYRPDPSTFDPETGRRKFHRVRVRVKRPGLRVRSRNGFFGVPEEAPARPTYLTRDEQLVAAMTSPFAAGDVHLKLTTVFTNGAKYGSYIHSLLHIDARDLTFVDEEEGWKKAIADVLVITFGDAGQEVDRSNKTFTMRLRGESFKNALQYGFVYSLNHPIKKAGAYQMRVAVRDAQSKKVGSASQFIEVPDVKKGRLALSGLVLKSYVEDPKPAANGAQSAGAPADQMDPRGTPAMRIFRPGRALSYGYQVLNAKVDSRTKRPSVEAQMHLYRDGQKIYTGRLAVIDGAGQTDLRRLIAGGRLQLGSKMKPGEYVLQVVVRDRLAKEKYNTAAQWMDFEIVK